MSPGRGFRMITVLGSSSAGNAYLVTDGRSPLLLDCGININGIMRGLQFGLSSLAGCLVSHEHADHSKAVKDLMKFGVDIYLSQGTVNEISGLGHFRHRINTIRALQQFALGSWIILPFDTVHDAAEPLGFLLATGDAKLLYLTDSAYCKYRFNGLTHILIECNHAADILNENVENGSVPAAMRRRVMRSHMSLSTVKGFLKANDLSRVREIHLIHLSDSNSDAMRFKSEIQALTGKPVYVAEK